MWIKSLFILIQHCSEPLGTGLTCPSQNVHFEAVAEQQTVGADSEDIHEQSRHHETDDKAELYDDICTRVGMKGE